MCCHRRRRRASRSRPSSATLISSGRAPPAPAPTEFGFIARTRTSVGTGRSPQVLLDTLPDYHLEDEQPSYVLAIECRPVVCALARLMPGAAAWQHVNWRALESQPGIMM